MIKVLRRFWILFLLLLFIPLSFVGGGDYSNAESINHYIQNTILIKEDGKVEQSLIMSCYFPETYNGLQVDAFKTQLRALLDVDLTERKAEIIGKYKAEDGEKYNPQTAVVFGDQGKAVKGKGNVGYTIQYASLDVYKYYNNLKTSYKKGFFLDKSAIVLDNPFNDVYENGGVYSNIADKYKQIYISAGEVVGVGEYVSTQYSPYYYNDYVTLSVRTKSSSYTVLKDSDNYTHHIWISDDKNLTSDDEMKLTLNVIHTGWWYLLGTSVPLVIMLISIVVVKISKNKNKSEN